MDRLTWDRFAPCFSPSLDNPADPVLAFHWLVEAWMLRVRWVAAPLCLLLIPLFPAMPPPYALGLALTLVLGNAGIRHQLRSEPSWPRLERVLRSASLLDWAVGLGVAFAGTGARPNSLPAVLVLLLLLGAVRYGPRGLVVALASSLVAVGALAAVQVVAIGVSEAQAALVAGRWAIVLVGSGLVVGSVARAGDECLRGAAACSKRDRDALRQVESRFSAREVEVLRLLPDARTYEQIAASLAISEDTVKSHVRHLGEKLQVRGRQKIVDTARERGLLPPDASPHANRPGFTKKSPLS